MPGDRKTEDVGSDPTVGASGPGAATPAAPPSVIANRYTIVGLLGAGGMGRVYRAHDRSLDEVVALKMLRRELLDVPGALDRFRQEVKLARRVTSAHVVRTYDLGEHEGDHFLTMEYIDGQSLARTLEDAQPPLEEVLRIARAACAGMATAHAAGVLHRDLKPDNILIAKDGRVAITDFGLARADADTSAAEGLVGTPAYMAPEQVEGDALIGPAADVYAFGGILYEMLTGTRPFSGRDPLAVARARLELPPPDPRASGAVPDVLAELVLRCLARDPGARFADAAALGVALAAIADQQVVAAIAAPRLAVPAHTARAVAVLPLESAEELAEVAAGLGEEIADALSMTRSLRVVPRATVRSVGAGDARQIGKRLDVDVVVEGALRRRGDDLRLTARVIGVVDGFQLWASHFDSAPERLLAMSDDVARAIARALTVEIDLPPRTAPLARATELYLESKAKVREHWFSGRIGDAVDDLEAAARLAPDDAGILANLSIAIARGTFLNGDPGELSRARELAERAIAVAPHSGEAWLALGLARLYVGDAPEAGFAFSRAVARAPGLAPGQLLIGGLLLEAGALSDAIAHLEAAAAIDPINGAVADLARAYIYAGRWQDGFDELRRARRASIFAVGQIARFKMWRAELMPDLDFGDLGAFNNEFARWSLIVSHVHRTGAFEPGGREELEERVWSGIPRMRASRMQFLAELIMFVGDNDAGLTWVERAIDAGLQDFIWLERCPMLDPLRTRPRFQELVEQLRQRATAVLASVRSAQT